MNWLIGTFIAVLITLHHLSISWIAESRSLESIMTGGITARIDTLALVLAFVLLRTLVFLLPGFMLSWFCLELIGFVLAKRELDAVQNRKDV